MMFLLHFFYLVDNQNFAEYNRQEVAGVIASHDTTILYFMTSWCQAGQSDFENNLQPYFGNASETKAIVVVCIGELEEVMGLRVGGGHGFEGTQ